MVLLCNWTSVVYRKLYKFFLRTNIKNLFAIGIFIPVLMSLLMALMHHLFPDIFSFSDDKDIMELIKQKPRLLISIILIGPVIETLLQYVPVKISIFFQKRFKYANLFAIILSATVFGYLHDGFAFMVFIPLFFAGLLWAFLCLVFIKRKIIPFVSITIIHGAYNAILLLLDYMIY